jgi:hypothetical protein
MTNENDPVIRKSIGLAASVWQQIDDFRFEHRLKSEAEVIRTLIERGLRPTADEAAAAQAAPRRPAR